MRIIFMGTPDFSVPTLEALVASGHEVVAVVTQPDKPKGRGKEIHMSPVKECALQHNIPVYQPVRARDEAFVEEMRALNPDAMVVIAFGPVSYTHLHWYTVDRLQTLPMAATVCALPRQP